jgi:hypothetical protein
VGVSLILGIWEEYLGLFSDIWISVFGASYLLHLRHILRGVVFGSGAGHGGQVSGFSCVEFGVDFGGQ